jgi:SAM-dependent methyltransferase
MLNPYKLLEVPFFYNLVQFCLGPGAKRIEARVDAQLFGKSSGLVLDVGCGPKLRTTLPAAAKVVGIDVNPQYVRSYADGVIDTSCDTKELRQSSRHRFGYVCSAGALPFPDQVFDEAMSRAVFHHFPPELVKSALREMTRCVKPGGRVTLMDCVWPRRPLLRPLAWLMMRFDRGEWVRTEEELLSLAQSVQPNGWNRIRFTSAYLGQEMVVLTWRKPVSALQAA